VVVDQGLEGEQVGPGGPQEVGIHLVHVLNHAKVVNPDTKLVIQYRDQNKHVNFKSNCVS